MPIDLRGPFHPQTAPHNRAHLPDHLLPPPTLHLLAQYLLKVRRQIVLVRMRGGGGGGGGGDASFEREVAQDLWAWGGEVVYRGSEEGSRACPCARAHSAHAQRTCSAHAVGTV